MKTKLIKNPLYSIFIGSFDLLTGIKVCHQLDFNESIGQQIEEIVKITLSNVHPQDQNSLEILPRQQLKYNVFHV